jgi:hypothetical protein
MARRNPFSRVPGPRRLLSTSSASGNINSLHGERVIVHPPSHSPPPSGTDSPQALREASRPERTSLTARDHMLVMPTTGPGRPTGRRGKARGRASAPAGRPRRPPAGSGTWHRLPRPLGGARWICGSLFFPGLRCLTYGVMSQINRSKAVRGSQRARRSPPGLAGRGLGKFPEEPFSGLGVPGTPIRPRGGGRHGARVPRSPRTARCPGGPPFRPRLPVAPSVSVGAPSGKTPSSPRAAEAPPPARARRRHPLPLPVLTARPAIGGTAPFGGRSRDRNPANEMRHRQASVQAALSSHLL